MIAPQRRSDRWFTAGLAAVLFALNAYITLPLFRVDYTREMGSIEAVYIGLARYILRHFPHFGWFPLWYGGIPYRDTYPPLLHFVVAGAMAAGRISPGLAYHFVTAAAYALGPVTLFWLALRLGAGRVPAFLGGLVYSVVSPSCWLSREIRFDAGGFWAARRLETLVRYGEGPHLFSMLLLPVALVALHKAMEEPPKKGTDAFSPGDPGAAIPGSSKMCLSPFGVARFVLAGVAMAAVALSNWLGAAALAVAAGAYLLAGFQKVRRAAWLRAGAIGLYAYALAAPWIPPSTIAVIRANAPRVGGNFESTLAQRAMFLAVALGMVLLAWLLARRGVSPGARFSLLFVCGMAAIALAAYWLKLDLVPQAKRYHLEMDMAFALAAAFAFARVRGTGVLTCAAVVAVLAAPIAIHQHRIAREWEKPIDIRTTVEYQTARWLDGHMPGARVFAPGTIGFWLNAFGDSPQLAGGFDNGIVNPFLQHVIYQIYAGDKQDVAIGWLKAYGCDAVIGGGPRSREVYHPYAHPAKFQGMTELWREGDDAIYAVPRRSPSLAHAMPASDLAEGTPVGYDVKAEAAYLAALDDPSLPAADFRWSGPSAARITGNFRPEDVLSVQVTWTSGWTARDSVSGARRRVWGDRLGQLVVEPRCDGRCTVDLEYNGGAEARAMRILCWLALAGGALAMAIALAPLLRR